MTNEEIWALHPNEPAPFTPAMVEAAEKVHGVLLPQALVDLLQIQNGGHTPCLAFPTDRVKYCEVCVHIDSFVGIRSEPKPGLWLGDLSINFLAEAWEVPEGLIILSGDGHTWITLDYRKGSLPTVAYLDLESDEDVQLAGSLEEFLSGLALEDDLFDD